MQSRRQSLIEAVINIIVGIGIAYVANILFLRAVGIEISHGQNVVMTLVMTAVSLARSYTLRRIFNRIHR